MSVASRYAHTLFADAVRQEADGKLALLGVYSNDIIFRSAPPGRLTSFVLMIDVCTPIEDPFRGTMKFSVKGAGLAPEPFTFEAPEPPSKHTEGSRQLRVKAILEILGATFTEPGRLVVEVDTGREVLYGGSLLVRFNPPPAAAAVQAEEADKDAHD